MSKDSHSSNQLFTEDDLFANFKISDVKIVCKELLDCPLEHDNHDYSDGCWKCRCCFGGRRKAWKKEEFQHDLDCPVLVAQDLMTRL